MPELREVFSVAGSKLFEFVKISQRISVSFTKEIEAEFSVELYGVDFCLSTAVLVVLQYQKLNLILNLH